MLSLSLRPLHGLTLLAVLCLASSSLALSQAPPELRIELALEQSPTLMLAVRVTAQGDQDGETLFKVSEDWGGVPPDRKDLHNVHAFDSQGQSLKLEARSNFEWAVQHEPGQMITLEAWLLANDLRGSGESSDHYRPMLEPQFFQAVGHLFLPLPEMEGPEDSTAPFTIQLDLAFDGFEEAGWDLVHSYGIGSEERSIILSPSKLSGMLFSAGQMQIHTREIRGGQLAVTLDSTQWKFDGEDFAELAAEIIDMERNFLEDDGAPFYWVGAIGVGDANASGYRFGGTGLSNSFALFLQPNTVIAEHSPVGPQVRKLLAHECFHEWNGLQIRLAAPEEENYWFSEGFTDYFARRILHEGQLIDDSTYMSMINTVLRDYNSSPVRNHSALELSKIFWTSMDGQKQPYLRGEMMAMIIDHAIIEHSGGEQDLADFMRALLQEAQANPSLELDTDRLLERIGRYTGEQILPSLRAICVDGASALLPAGCLGPQFEIHASTTNGFEAGFDVDASTQALRIIGLLEGSAAERSGVKDGDEILGFSMQFGQAQLPVSLTLRTGPDGEPRKLSYIPKGPAIECQDVRPATK